MDHKDRRDDTQAGLAMKFPLIRPMQLLFRYRLLAILTLPLLFTSCGTGPGETDAYPHNTTWRHYLGDPERSHFSSLDQITSANVQQLKVVWSYQSGGMKEKGQTQMQTNPLVWDTLLFGVNAGMELFAIHAASGVERWTFSPPKSKDSGLGVNRGLSLWQSDDADPSRLFFSAGSFLYAVDPFNGQLLPSFGDAGSVDLRQGLGRDPEKLAVVANTPGAIYNDLLVLGTRVSESPGAAPGHIRAYDVKTGEIRWTFHTIPRPGDEGDETWPVGAYQYVGGANSWAGMALDGERGMVFVPTGSAAFDFYGGDRIGSNLFANCLLALDAQTGKRIWHYQFVHHDIWDRDLPAPPNLVTLQRGGKEIPAVAQVTKSGHVFVFNRETGDALFPIEEQAFPASTLDGDVAWETQPIPLKPDPFARQRLTEDMLYAPDSLAYIADFVDKAINDEPLTVKTRFGQVTSEGQFIPPDTTGVIVFPGFDGGAEWGGAAVDPRSGWLFVNSNEMPWIIRMKKMEGEVTGGSGMYALNCARCHGGNRQGLGAIPALRDLQEKYELDEVQHIIKNGLGAMPPNPQFDDAQLEAIARFVLDEESTLPKDHRAEVVPQSAYSVAGFGRFLDNRKLPVVKPPWGTLNAIDLNTGEYIWRVPLGHIDEINDPLYPVTGTENYGGPVVTAGNLIFIAATKDEKVRAFDKETGQQLWEAALPAGGYATPATYQVDGKQFLVVTCGGGKMGTKSGDFYVAFALP